MIMNIKKISYTELRDFSAVYYRTDACKNMRYGQAFLNKFYPAVVDPNLFYQENDVAAVNMIFEKYVDFDKQ